jgi:hypothetical protein
MADGADDHKTGRPTTFTQELATTIVARIMGGESLRAICRDELMPARSTVHLWLATNESFSDQYARACEIRAEELFDEMFEIADDGTNDWMIRGSGENATEVVNGENVQRSRLRIDTRKWALARMNPKKFGDKITNEVVGKDGGPIATTSIDAKKLSKAQLEALATIRLPTDAR